ncbi:MAG: hypothetical protein IPP29_24670 [Bacteroidetes bacterium]|nr:hypothetical protein [Bacteroidota bacterium]
MLSKNEIISHRYPTLSFVNASTYKKIVYVCFITTPTKGQYFGFDG